MAWVLFLTTALAVSAPRPAASSNSELRPAARLVFPYFDIRPGTTTILLLTNVSDQPLGARLTFYDATCDRRGRSLALTPKDMAVIDLAKLFGGDDIGRFAQGFVDVEAGRNSLIGAAQIVNVAEDWSVVYHPAASQRLDGPDSTFERFPAHVALPSFFAPGVGERRLDGFLVLVAPNPTEPGDPLPEEAIRASIDVFSPAGPSVSLSASGHQVILPLASFSGWLPDSAPGWLEIRNQARDDQGEPVGLVGLFIQTLVAPGGGGGMAGAIRLWGWR